jgi:hypothetical protein
MQNKECLTGYHWSLVEEYCDGVRSREIEDKYQCCTRTIVDSAKTIGIKPRPTGFSSYSIAHEWVLQARIDYAELRNARFS